MLSLGAWFEFYDLFFSGYIAPALYQDPTCADEIPNRVQLSAAYTSPHLMQAHRSDFALGDGRVRSRRFRMTPHLGSFAFALLIAGWQHTAVSANPRNGRHANTTASVSQHPKGRLLLVAYALPAQDSGKLQSPISSLALTTCAGIAEAVRAAEWRLQRDQQTTGPASGPTSDSTPQDSKLSTTDLQTDMDSLQHAQAELGDCLSNRGASPPDPSASECSKTLLMNFEMSGDGQSVREVPIWQQSESDGFFYEAGMTIDADGAPNAYNPQNTGIDDLSNAGEPGAWEALAKDMEGNPLIQGPNDPYPGYYVSTTALADRTMPYENPRRYVDATKIPFIVLPSNLSRELGARPGDLSVVFNLQNGRSSPAIFGDVGPVDHIGEGSVALAENLGIRPDPKNGGTRGRILYLIFPGSGNRQPRPLEEIHTEAASLLQAWGGIPRLVACTGE